MADHGGVTRAFGHFDGGEGFRECANLVDLDQDRIGDALRYAFFEDFGVGDEQVITDDLHFFAQAICQQFPAVPVVLGHAVFYADDGVLVHPSGHDVDPLFAGEHEAFGLKVVLAIFVELAGGAIQAEGDLLAGHKTCRCNRFQNHLDRRFVVRHIRREAAFITHGHTHAFVVQDFLECVEHLDAVTHRFTKTRRAHGDDHQLLQIEVVVGVRAAVDHVHHWHRHLHAAHAPEVAVQRQAAFFRRRAGHSHGHGQHGVGAQARFVLRAIEVDQCFV